MGCGNNGRLPHLFIPSKTATLVPEFAGEKLSLGRTAALLPAFEVKDLPLDRTHDFLILYSVLLARCDHIFSLFRFDV